MIRNTISAYGLVAKFLHWLMAVLLIGLYLVGTFMTGMDLSPDKLQVYQWHKSLGIVVLMLVLFRLVWKLANPSPKLPATMQRWEILVSQSVHYALYALMFLTPLAGWMMSNYAGYPVSVFGLFTLPNLVDADKPMLDRFKDLHELLATAIMVVAAAHAAAAFHHYFVKKDGVLGRMWFGR